MNWTCENQENRKDRKRETENKVDGMRVPVAKSTITQGGGHGTVIHPTF